MSLAPVPHVQTGKFGNTNWTIGPWTYGLEHVTVSEWKEGATLTVGSFCSFADKIRVLMGGNHDTNAISTYPFYSVNKEMGMNMPPPNHSTNGDVIIGNDVWICSGATILSGVTIGNGAVIAANATVTRDVGDYEIVGGAPARLLRHRFDPEIRDLLLKLSWWSLPLPDIKKIIPLLNAKPNKDQLMRLIQQYRGIES